MSIDFLQKTANELRYMALEAIADGGSGHPGGSLSIAEIIAVLYFKEMHIDPANPLDPNRDRLVLSKGHACPILYAALALKGFFCKEELKKLRHIDSFLQGHPDMKHTPGIDMSTGSLGQGISAACGIALAAFKKEINYRVFAILGDGEIEEGEVWEALMFAAHYHLYNLTVFIDHNGLQIDGSNQEVMPVSNLKAVLLGFGLNVIEINGNDIGSIIKALDEAKSCRDRPTVIIADTIKGKGVSFMENQVGWHGKAPSAKELSLAKTELGV